MPPLFEELKQKISGEIFADNISLTKASRDGSPFIVRPQIIVYPKNVKDISEAVIFSKKYNIPITARGAGNGGRGGALTDGIVIDLERYFDQIGKINYEKGTVPVQAGMLYRELEAKMENWDMCIPFARRETEEMTIGGMAGNGYKGPYSVLYGGMVDWIEEIKVVLDDGKEYLINKDIFPEGRLKEIYESMLLFLKHEAPVIRAGAKAVEHQSQGYEIYATHISPRKLIEVLIGSQGTLGIITEISFRLTKKKPVARGLSIRINKISEISKIQTILIEGGATSIEGFDKNALTFFQKMNKKDSLIAHEKNPFTLFALFEGNEDEIKKKIENVYLKIGSSGENKAVIEKETLDEYILVINNQKSSIKESSGDFLEVISLLDDLALPREELPELIVEIESILRESSATYSVCADFGNGVLKIVYLEDLSNEKSANNLAQMLINVSAVVRRVRGTMSYSLGDGIAMTPLLPFIFGSNLADAMRALKFIWDPNNIFNPGKKTTIDFSYFKKHIDHLPPGLKHP